jgi:hypothetical protein
MAEPVASGMTRVARNIRKVSGKKISWKASAQVEMTHYSNLIQTASFSF